MTLKFFKDPNLDAIIAKRKEVISANPSAKAIIIVQSWKFVKPVIKVDTAKKYVADYTDDYGTYEFTIKKQNGSFVITSDNQKVHSGSDINYIRWNFECQLREVNPKVLG
jgi:hypothetical protein